MDILTGMVSDYVIEKGLVTLTIVDELGTRKSQTFYRGKYSQQDFAAFKSQNVIIEFETGNKEYPKLLRIQYLIRGDLKEGSSKSDNSLQPS